MLLVILLTNFCLVYGIIGGYNITISHAPYSVNYGDVCGGAIIHKQWVLTTAHCGPNHTYIRIGSTYRLEGPKINIFTHIIHPLYGLKHKFDFDVQLLELFRKLHFSKLIAPIPISIGEHGDTISIAGWGYEKEKGDYHDVLQQVEMGIVSMKTCQEFGNTWFNNTLTSRMFCAGGWGRDACQGDSGAAAVSLGKLVGISSFGFGCGRNLPGVYTNITNSVIRKWIRFYTGV